MLCEPQDRGKLKREPGWVEGAPAYTRPGSTLLRSPSPDGLLHPSLATPSPSCPSDTHIERGPRLASSRVTPKPWRATSPAAVFPLSPPSPPPTSTQLLTHSQLLPPPKTLPAPQPPSLEGAPTHGPSGTRTNSPSQASISRNPRWPTALSLCPWFPKTPQGTLGAGQCLIRILKLTVFCFSIHCCFVFCFVFLQESFAFLRWGHTTWGDLQRPEKADHS